MARKKDAVVARSASSRSSASIFANLESPAQLDKIEAVPKEEHEEETDGSHEPEEDAKFPLSLIYEFQDFLNGHLTLRKGFELMCCLYLCQIFYLHLSDIGATDVMYAMGFNVMGALIAMYLSHKAQVRKHAAAPESSVYPALPHFNIIYSLFIPCAFFLLYSDYTDPFFQVNLSLTNFAIPSLNPMAKMLSSFVYYYMFNENDTIEFVRFAQVIWLYYIVDYSLNHWNSKTFSDSEGKHTTFYTLDPTEIHLIALLFVNVLTNFHLKVTETSMPLVIVHILAIALIGALGAAFPLYYLYTNLDAGALRSLVSVMVVSVSGAVFYFLTNYLFQQKVKQENAVQWLLEYITKSEQRTSILLNWVSVLAVSIPIVFFVSHKNWISLNIRRKIWHFIITGCLAYPIVQDPVFTTIAATGSIFVFVAIEFLSASQLTFVGGLLNRQLKIFQDFKDSYGPLNLSYIYLLAGVSLPLAMGVLVDDVVSLRSYMGLVTLGLGDSAASIVGRKFGKRKWAGGNKTFEGTAAFIVATFAGFYLVDAYLLPQANRVTNWENVLIVALIGGAVEGASTLNDNVLIPCMSMITYDIVRRVFK